MTLTVKRGIAYMHCWVREKCSEDLRSDATPNIKEPYLLLNMPVYFTP